MVSDINPGHGGNPTDLTNVNGLLFFSANDGVHGYELWESNGTRLGTSLVADIDPGSDSSYPYDLVNVGGTLFFDANDGVHGHQLWRSGGTAQTTSLVTDINPGAEYGLTEYTTLVNANGTLFFSANDGTHGAELWQSNGTAAGTFMVKDINPGPAGSYPYHLTNINGTLFFEANNGVFGQEPWILGPLPASAPGGSLPGASILPSISVGTGSAVTPLPSGARGKGEGAEEFAATTVAPTPQLLRNINQSPTITNISGLTAVGSTLFFAASDGVHGEELWESNGAIAGTQLVADINPVRWFVPQEPDERQRDPLLPG